MDDGNGSIARALSDMLLARVENCFARLYSMSDLVEKGCLVQREAGGRSPSYDVL